MLLYFDKPIVPTYYSVLNMINTPEDKALPSYHVLKLRIVRPGLFLNYVSYDKFLSKHDRFQRNTNAFDISLRYIVITVLKYKTELYVLFVKPNLSSKRCINTLCALLYIV